MVSGCRWIRTVDPGLYLLEEEEGWKVDQELRRKGESRLVGKCLRPLGQPRTEKGSGDFRPQRPAGSISQWSPVWCAGCSRRDS